MTKMAKTILARSLWMARGTATMMGMALMLALILGVVTTALAAVPGDPFKLGRINTIDEMSTLVGSAPGALLKVDNEEGDGTALNLRVDSGEAPMNVNSTKRVNDLNADRLDGKSADDIGFNGLRVVTDRSDVDSASRKNAVALCNPGGGTSPRAVVGIGYELRGANGGQPPEGVVVNTANTFSTSDGQPSSGAWARAAETQPVAADWSVEVKAICAKVGAP
jgi:hypothetical protein